jgi:hypothetical protein
VSHCVGDECVVLLQFCCRLCCCKHISVLLEGTSPWQMQKLQRLVTSRLCALVEDYQQPPVLNVMECAAFGHRWCVAVLLLRVRLLFRYFLHSQEPVTQQVQRLQHLREAIVPCSICITLCSCHCLLPHAQSAAHPVSALSSFFSKDRL